VDLVSHAKDPTAALNGVCAHLSEICNADLVTSGSKRDAKQIATRRTALKTILTEFIRDGMGTVIPAVWRPHWNESQVPYVLAEAFETEILTGHQVHLDHMGAAISQG
jgi:hypothetical protein